MNSPKILFEDEDGPVYEDDEVQIIVRQGMCRIHKTGMSFFTKIIEEGTDRKIIRIPYCPSCIYEKKKRKKLK